MLSAVPSPTRLDRSRGHGPIDFYLLIAVLSLTFIGLITIFSASAHVDVNTGGTGAYYLKKQFIAAIIGLIAMGIALFVDIHFWRRSVQHITVVMLILLLLIHIPGFGVTAKGATRWIDIGFMSLQPSELAKFTIVLLCSTMLASSRYAQLNWLHKLITLLPIGALMFSVLFQPDLGTSLVMGMAAFSVFICGGAKLKNLSIFIVLAAIAVAFKSWHTEYQRNRLISFMDPWQDPLGIGFQMVQSLMAIGSGGIWGVGIGQSVQKLFYLPEQHTDFAFAVLAEEMGLVGTLLVIGLWMLVAHRGFRIALRTTDPFAKLMAAGITTLTCGQAFLNIAVVTGTIPATGIPLPFISYGGTSLLLTLFNMGLLLNISRMARPQFQVLSNEQQTGQLSE